MFCPAFQRQRGRRTTCKGRHAPQRYIKSRLYTDRRKGTQLFSSNPERQNVVCKRVENIHANTCSSVHHKGCSRRWRHPIDRHQDCVIENTPGCVTRENKTRCSRNGHEIQDEIGGRGGTQRHWRGCRDGRGIGSKQGWREKKRSPSSTGVGDPQVDVTLDRVQKQSQRSGSDFFASSRRVLCHTASDGPTQVVAARDKRNVRPGRIAGRGYPCFSCTRVKDQGGSKI